MSVALHPVRAELVEAHFFRATRPEKKEKPFDRLRANGDFPTCRYISPPFGSSVEQAVLPGPGLRKAEMGPAPAVEAAAAGGSGDEAQLDEERLDHLLDRVARLG